MTIGESLKRFRKEFNLTRSAVAEVLGIKPQSYIYEVKDVTPSAQVIIDLAKNYNVSTDYLLGLTDNPNPLNRSSKFINKHPNESEELVKALVDTQKNLNLALQKLGKNPNDFES